MSDALYRDMIRIISDLQRKVERLESIERVTTGTPADITAIDTRVTALETYQMPTSDVNVSNPPTDGELDGIWVSPAAVGDGWIGFVDDAGAGSQVWLITSDGTNWWFQQLTKAV